MMAKEYIERNELIENLQKFAPEHYNALINQLITKQPTADVAEVVRCGNCKHSNEDGTICRYSVGRAVEPTHYCSYGERKNENSN